MVGVRINLDVQVRTPLRVSVDLDMDICGGRTITRGPSVPGVPCMVGDGWVGWWTSLEPLAVVVGRGLIRRIPGWGRVGRDRRWRLGGGSWIRGWTGLEPLAVMVG